MSRRTKVAAIRPGILVAFTSRLQGGVRYTRTDLETTAERSHWETVKETDDPAEHARGVKERAKAQALIRAVCARTSFGLLCRQDREDDLDAAIARAGDVVGVFNIQATTCHISISVLKGRVAADDLQAVQAITEELADLIEQMRKGVLAGDVKAIRDAASKATSAERMLSEPVAASARAAVVIARQKARELVRRVEKGGEKLANISSGATTRALLTRRMAFLELASNAAALPADEPEQPSVIDAIRARPLKPTPTVAADPEPTPEPEPATPVLDRQRFADIDIDWS